MPSPDRWSGKAARTVVAVDHEVDTDEFWECSAEFWQISGEAPACP